MNQEHVDIAIIIPKGDELVAAEWVFGATFQKSDGKIGDVKKPYYRLNFKTDASEEEISIAFICMYDQGNTIATGVTDKVIAQLTPSLLFLLGTARGRRGKVGIGSVIVSAFVWDVSEWRIGKQARPRPRQRYSEDAIGIAATGFIDKSLPSNWDEELFSIPLKLYKGAKPPTNILNRPRKVHLLPIASANTLQMDPRALSKIWDLDENIAGIEMEAGGFGSACGPARRWLVIKGASDYGTRASKKPVYRTVSAASAALFLREFIRRGLSECHPRLAGAREPEPRQVPVPLQTVLPEPKQVPAPLQTVLASIMWKTEALLARPGTPRVRSVILMAEIHFINRGSHPEQSGFPEVLLERNADKKQWHFVPQIYINHGEFMRRLRRARTKLALERVIDRHSVVERHFTPVFLEGGRSSTEAIVFAPATGFPISPSEFKSGDYTIGFRWTRGTKLLREEAVTFSLTDAGASILRGGKGLLIPVAASQEIS